MFKALITILLFVTSSLSYAEQLKSDTPKDHKNDVIFHDSVNKGITRSEWLGFLISAGSWWYIIIGKKSLEHNSYIHSRIEKTPLHHFKRPHVMKVCSWSGVAIGSLLLFASEIGEYLKR